MLRLSWLMAALACSRAGAEPAPPAGAMAPPGPRPAGWTQLPAMASAVSAAAAGDGVTVAASDAWGDPARGCYGVWLDLRGGDGEPPALADQLIASLPAAMTAPGRGTVSELVRSSDGALALRFASPPYRGRVRAQLATGRVAMVACFANQREPAACEAACTGVLDGDPAAAAARSAR